MSSTTDHLLIFPGGGSPHNERYASLYRLLDCLGKNHGYTQIKTLVWPAGSRASPLLQLILRMHPVHRRPYCYN